MATSKSTKTPKRSTPVKKATARPKPGPVKGTPNRASKDLPELKSEVRHRIAANFARIRKQAGLTLVEFARSLGFSESYAKGIERGNFAPSHDVIYKTSRLYKRTIDWIYTNRG